MSSQKNVGTWLIPPYEIYCKRLIQCIWCVKKFKISQGYAIYKKIHVEDNDPLRKKNKYGKVKFMSVINSVVVVPTNLIADGNISIDFIQNIDEITNKEGNAFTDLIQNTDEIIIVGGNISTDLIQNTDEIKIGYISVEISKIQHLDDDSVAVIECKTINPARQRN